jgi:hypothetical protein
LPVGQQNSQATEDQIDGLAIHCASSVNLPDEVKTRKSWRQVPAFEDFQGENFAGDRTELAWCFDDSIIFSGALKVEARGWHSLRG